MHNKTQRLQKLSICYLRSQTYINSRVTNRINSFPPEQKSPAFTLPIHLCLGLNRSSCSQLSLEPHIQDSHHHIPNHLYCNRATACFLSVTKGLWRNLCSLKQGNSHFIWSTPSFCADRMQTSKLQSVIPLLSIRSISNNNSTVQLVLKLWDLSPNPPKSKLVYRLLASEVKLWNPEGKKLLLPLFVNH